MYPTFCDELKLGPNNPELSVEELKTSALSQDTRHPEILHVKTVTRWEKRVWK